MELLDLKPSQIKTHPRNPRGDVGDLAELADSIRSVGILEPLIVAPADGSTGKYWLIAGHRRLAAAKVAGVKVLPGILREDLDTPAKQVEAMLVENLQRSDLTAVEEGAAYQTLLEFPGYTMARISKATGRNVGTVRGRVAIAKLPEGTRARIHAGQITIDQATELAKYSADSATLRRLEAAAGTSSWTWELQRVKDAAAADRRIAKTTKQLTAEGIRVIDATTLPNGWRWGSSAGAVQTLIRLGIAVDDHAQCEGHGVTVDHNGDAVYICTTPTAHGPAATSSDPEFAKQQAEEERLKDLLRSAATLRAEHLGAAIHAGDVGMAHQLLLTAAQDQLRRHWTRSKARIRAMLGAADKASADDATAAITGYTLAQLAILRDVLHHLDDDENLNHVYTWRDGSYTQAWRTRLGTIYGWEWTEGELEVLAANNAEAAEWDDEDEQPS